MNEGIPAHTLNSFIVLFWGGNGGYLIDPWNDYEQTNRVVGNEDMPSDVWYPSIQCCTHRLTGALKLMHHNGNYENGIDAPWNGYTRRDSIKIFGLR